MIDLLVIAIVLGAVGAVEDGTCDAELKAAADFKHWCRPSGNPSAKRFPTKDASSFFEITETSCKKLACSNFAFFQQSSCDCVCGYFPSADQGTKCPEPGSEFYLSPDTNDKATYYRQDSNGCFDSSPRRCGTGVLVDKPGFCGCSCPEGSRTLEPGELDDNKRCAPNYYFSATSPGLGWYSDPASLNDCYIAINCNQTKEAFSALECGKCDCLPLDKDAQAAFKCTPAGYSGQFFQGFSYSNGRLYNEVVEGCQVWRLCPETESFVATAAECGCQKNPRIAIYNVNTQDYKVDFVCQLTYNGTTAEFKNYWQYQMLQNYVTSYGDNDQFYMIGAYWEESSSEFIFTKVVGRKLIIVPVSSILPESVKIEDLNVDNTLLGFVKKAGGSAILTARAKNGVLRGLCMIVS